MSDRHGGGPRLLVSVRDAAEARAAIEGGADVIDVKEPSAGPLGAASVDATIAVAIEAGTVPGLPWTLACGELVDVGVDGVLAHVEAVCRGLGEVVPGRPPKPWLVKVGLSGMAGRPWRDDLARIAAGLPGGIVQAAVAYADWHGGDAPDPEAIFREAPGLGGVVLLDTFDKAAGSCLAIAGESAIRRLADLARSEGVWLALAGRISPADAGWIADLRPDIVAVRSAVCRGGRMGRVEAGLTARLRSELRRRAATGMLQEFGQGFDRAGAMEEDA